MAGDDAYPPTAEFEMPDVAHLGASRVMTVFLARVLLGIDLERFVANNLTITLARLCDKCVEEYTRARELVLQYLRAEKSADLTVLFRATNHMETFTGTLLRACKIAGHARRERDTPKISKAALPSKSDINRLNGIRRVIEHMDNRIVDGRIAPGDPTLLMLTNDSVELEGIRIRYEELAGWLTQLSDVCDLIRRAELDALPGWDRVAGEARNLQGRP